MGIRKQDGRVIAQNHWLFPQGPRHYLVIRFGRQDLSRKDDWVGKRGQYVKQLLHKGDGLSLDFLEPQNP